MAELTPSTIEYVHRRHFSYRPHLPADHRPVLEHCFITSVMAEKVGARRDIAQYRTFLPSEQKVRR
jgi:hypothetical protein